MARIKKEIYHKLLVDIKNRIRTAQYEALKAVNKELIQLYQDIGKLIVKKQQKELWGKSVVERLAKDLQLEFPGIKGFSAPNLWKMRKFYEKYAKNQKLSTMSIEISWSHNVVIMTKCKSDIEIEFYMRMSRRYGWTHNVLIHQIENKTYEKTFINQTNFEKALPKKIKDQAKLAVKDEYNFDFLDLGDEFTERQLERGLIDRVEPFLREMGGMFTYVGSQYRLEVDEEEYYIDILLYNRYLKCLVAIELKIGKFLPEYVGKMQFYLAALDDTVRVEGENPSIGIILCKSKKKTIVEYALKESNKPIGVAAYEVVSKLPKLLKGKLPSPEQMSKLMEKI